MTACMITEEMVKNIVEKRRREIHKGDCGRILMVAGSEGMMGAAVLTCTAALRSGAGLVQLAVPKDLFPIAQIAVPEATCLDRNFNTIDLDRYDVIAVGPGLGESRESVDFVKELLEKWTGRLVLDADGLNIAAHNDLLDKLRMRDGETIISPHMGEAQRLAEAAAKAGVISEETLEALDFRSSRQSMRECIAYVLSEAWGAITILKGQHTVVTSRGEVSYINTTGNPGMATGGSGDVLTGILSGLWGQKGRDGNRHSALEIAGAGVYIHGAAGDLAAEKLGEYGLIAGDIAGHVPFAVKKLSE